MVSIRKAVLGVIGIAHLTNGLLEGSGSSGLTRAKRTFSEAWDVASGVAQSVAEKVAKTAKDHPVAAGMAAVGAVGVCAPGVIVNPLLPLAGFGQQGVAAGSVAASVQSAIGPVQAGSLFATLQSAGAGGAGWGTLIGYTQAAGATIMGGLAVAAGASSKDNNQSKKPDSDL